MFDYTTPRLLLAVSLLGTANLSLANGPAIGLAVGSGTFTVDSAAVRGNSTIFDGSAVATAKSSSHLQLNAGPRMILGANSRAVVFGSKLVLERGAGELRAARNYDIVAAGLRITPAEGAVARVQYTDAQSVVVAAETGPVGVRNAAGVLVARIQPGMALSLTPRPDASVTNVTGCVTERSGKLVIADETTNVVFEVQGAEIHSHVGRRVELTASVAGKSSVHGASELLNVSSARRLEGGCNSTAGKAAGAAAAGAGARGAAGAAAATGLSTAAKVAIIGGVAAASSVGGLVATDVIGGDEEPSTSR